MKCPKCQTENPDTQKFCGECGTNITHRNGDSPSLTRTLETPLEPLTRGTLFADRYEIIEELGRGGMGAVYRVEDIKAREEIALKLIKPEIAADEKTIHRFRKELTTARRIRHKNICAMYDLNENKGTYYIKMEYVPGQDLKRLIRQTRRLAIDTAISIIKQVCEGLSEAHRLGVVHRDLKPHNIMIDREGTVRIMDFGIARSSKEKGFTGAGVVVGTPEYMPPEQAEAKEVDQRSDIYSLGIMFYEMLTGTVPFKGDTPLSIAMKHKSETPIPPYKVNKEISDEISRIILRCLKKDKENRYSTALELLSDLKRAAEPEDDDTKSPQWESSVAVLPFTNLSGDPDQEYFCDGITEELINSLTRINKLRVIARTSSFMFKGKHEDIREIGRKLNVDTLLEGSVRKSGDRLRISAQLVDASDGSHIWSERFDREMEDIFKIQDEISLAIADKLKVRLLGEERIGLVKRSTENTDAYSLYLRGRFFWNRRTPEGLSRSLDFFKEAIEIDPRFALAYAGSATTYTLLAIYDYLPASKAYQKAKENALKALDIDNTISEAHTTMARIKDFYEWDWQGAKAEFEKAIELNPSDADTIHKFSHLLTEMGHHDESIKAMNRALDLEPLAIEINSCLGMNLYLARRYDEAIEQLNKASELDPHYFDPYGWMGMALVQSEKYQEAFDVLKKAEGFPEIRYRMIGAQVYANAVAGNSSRAEEKLGQLMGISEKESVEPYFIAWAYVGLEQNDRALDYLEKAFEIRSCFMRMLVKVDPWFDSLQSEPRFAALLTQMDLE
jgi:serine/threonine protein kinase/Tfp pilus assembly protein PilF